MNPDKQTIPDDETDLREIISKSPAIYTVISFFLESLKKKTYF